MELRDLIAVTVLPLVLDDPEAFVEVRSVDKAGVAARAAYRIADAMLEARGHLPTAEKPCSPNPVQNHP